MEILELKCVIIEMKNSLHGIWSIADLRCQKKELIGLKIGQYKLPNLKIREKENEQSFRDLQHSIKHAKRHILESQKERRGR